MRSGAELSGSLFAHNEGAPGAGTNFAFVPESSFHYILHVVRFRIVTDATVTNRYPSLQITWPTAQLLDIIAPTAIPASQTVDVTFIGGLGIGASYAANRYMAGLPQDFWIMPGSLIGSDVRNLQAGDVLSIISATYRRWAGPT